MSRARPETAPSQVDVSAPTTSGEDGSGLPAPVRLLVLAAVAVVGGLIATVPLVLSVTGLVELLALVQSRWDPTWNDGDLGISAMGVVALLVTLGGVAAAGGAVGPIGRFRRRGVVVAAALGTLLVAAAVFAGFTALRG